MSGQLSHYVGERHVPLPSPFLRPAIQVAGGVAIKALAHPTPRRWPKLQTVRTIFIRSGYNGMHISMPNF